MSAPFKIIISGEGGQGIQSIAKIIAHAAYEQGLKATYMPYFSTEKRGGISTAFAQVGDENPVYPKFDKADLWVALSERGVGRIYDHLKPGSIVIVNSFLVKDVSRIKKWEPIEIDAGTIANEKLGTHRTFNVIIMGAMIKHIPGLKKDAFLKAMEKTFAKHYAKDERLKALNERALDIGYELS